MRYVSLDRDEATIALRRASQGQSIFAAEYNAIVAFVGMTRDALVSPSFPRVGVQDTLGAGRTGPLVGWSEPSGLTGDREVAYAALGYALRKLRTGHRLMGRGGSASVPVGDSWPDRVAVTGEVDTSLVSPTAIAPDTRVDIDPATARNVQDALLFSSDILEGRSPASDLSSRVAWMAREYATTSRRAEWIAYTALAGGTMTVLLLLGAFKRKPVAPQPGQQPALGGVPTDPYGDAMARPRFS